MEELYVEGLATRGGPESCVASRKGRGEAWRKAASLVALPRVARGPRAVRDPWHVRNLHAREPGEPVSARPRWSAGGPPGERQGGNPGMNGHGQSDRFVGAPG